MKSFQGTLCSSHEWEGWWRVTCLWASLHRAGPGRVTGPFPAPRQSWLPAPLGWATEEPVLWVSSSLLIPTGEKRDYPPLLRVT